MAGSGFRCPALRSVSDLVEGGPSPVVVRDMGLAVCVGSLQRLVHHLHEIGQVFHHLPEPNFAGAGTGGPL